MSPELLSAVKERIQIGHTRSEIEAELKSSGYTDEQIADICTQASQYEAPAQAESTPATPLIGYQALLKAAWNVFKTNWKLFVKAFLVSAVVLLAVVVVIAAFIGVTAAETFTTIANWEGAGDIPFGLIALLYTVLLLISVFLRVITFAIIKNLTTPEATTFRESLRWTAHNIVPVILLGVFSYLAIQTGYVMLFIPGVAASIYFYFADYFLATENARGFDAMVRSTEVVYNRWWSVVGRLLYVALMYLLLGMLGIFAVLALVALSPLNDAFGNALFIVPSMLLAGALYVSLMQCAVFVLFQSLQSSQHPQVFSDQKKTSLRYWFKVMAIFGPLAILVLQAPGMITEDAIEQAGNPVGQPTEQAVPLSQQLQGAFELGEIYYYAEGNFSYEGVCAAALEAITEENRGQIECNQTSEQWAIQGSEDSAIWCLDSEGYDKQVYMPLGERTTCLALPDATELETVVQPEIAG